VKILVIPDKFKGTLTASVAAEAIARGWRKVRPRDAIELLPMSDGGDGFGQTIGSSLGAKVQTVHTVDAAHRKCAANWWWDPKSRTAVIESANVIGLAKLPPGQFHPFELDTFGLGAMICAAANKGAKRCIIGIGGSATNDGGFGLARALGWNFSDRAGKPIQRWTELHRLARISPPARKRWFKELIVAVDVQNPLLGRRGATRIYGQQKDLRPHDFATAEKCLRRLALVFQQSELQIPKPGKKVAAIPGAGAAGGLGFGLMAFAGARAGPGFDLFAKLANLDKRLRAADLVITGEGAIDASTFMGKGVGEIGRRCRKWRIPCIAIAGVLAVSAEANRLFADAFALTDLTTVEAAKKNPGVWLERVAARVAQTWQKAKA
jgi:glycerate kinase